MSKSENLYSAARELIPGGVNSPVRAFTGVGGTPLFIEKADGAYLYDVDGKAYIDYVGSWGPMVLGHNHPAIRNAVIEAAERGLSFGAPTEMEVKMAQLVTELVPTMDMVRMVNSGTEAGRRWAPTAQPWPLRSRCERTVVGPAKPTLPRGCSGDTDSTTRLEAGKARTCWREVRPGAMFQRGIQNQLTSSATSGGAGKRSKAGSRAGNRMPRVGRLTGPA